MGVYDTWLFLCLYIYSQTCVTIVTKDHEFEKEKGETCKVLKKGELEGFYNFKEN